MRREVENWWHQAQIDLDSAQTTLRSGLFYVCAFLCEQAAQKALKALYMSRKRALPPRTHNLVDVGKLVGADESLLVDLRHLSPHFILTRYPDAAGGVPADLYDETRGDESITRAKRVIDWVRDRLEKS